MSIGELPLDEPRFEIAVTGEIPAGVGEQLRAFVLANGGTVVPAGETAADAAVIGDGDLMEASRDLFDGNKDYGILAHDILSSQRDASRLSIRETETGLFTVVGVGTESVGSFGTLGALMTAIATSGANKSPYELEVVEPSEDLAPADRPLRAVLPIRLTAASVTHFLEQKDISSEALRGDIGRAVKVIEEIAGIATRSFEDFDDYIPKQVITDISRELEAKGAWINLNNRIREGFLPQLGADKAKRNRLPMAVAGDVRFRTAQKLKRYDSVSRTSLRNFSETLREGTEMPRLITAVLKEPVRNYR